MKTKALILAMLASSLTGCEMAAVSDWGADCPGLSSEGELGYIGDKDCNADEPICTFSDSDDPDRKYDFSKNFEISRCPAEFPRCVFEDALDAEDPDAPDAVIYHCEPKKSCADDQFACELDNGQTKCVDPKAITTCGASESKCDKKNYGGQDCSKFGMSTCVEDGDSYACQCLSGTKRCGTQCLSPSSPETCGADDCDKENYGGDDCTAYDDNRECQEFKKGKYRCQCRKNDVMCDSSCITPSSDQRHCGAKGKCSSGDPDDEDFEGEDCEAGKGICKNGVCTCTSDQIWCIPQGSNTPQCVSPLDPKTCGAHLIENSGRCEFTACDEGKACRSTSDGYQCDVSECVDPSTQMCPVNGSMECISKLDPLNCGFCNAKCESQTNGFAHGNECKFDGSDYKCNFVCIEGYVNCPPGDEFSPNCINTKSDRNNCGECGKACQTEEACIDGHCQTSTCLANQCQTQDANGKPICDNSDAKCGSNCDNCLNLSNQAHCVDGTCVYSGCEANQHPLYNGTQISGCENNSVSKCAPLTIKVGDPIVDCNASMPQNAASMECSSEGQCIVTACTNNTHIAADHKSCVANTPQACGSGTSTSTVDCTSGGNSATCNDGSCSITSCNPGYHLNGQNCEINTQTSCGPTNGPGQNCLTNNVASATCSTSGQCIVTNCSPGYHINSSLTGCERNSSSSCAPSNSSNTKSCNGLTCSNSGECECGSGLVLNWNGSACVDRACMGVPGIQQGTALTANFYNGADPDYACKAITCAPGYERYTQETAATCHPTGGSCPGYKASNCTGCGGPSGCSMNSCQGGYRFYVNACLEYDVCCGTTSDWNAASYYRCTNCRAQGKQCDTGSGTCY